MTPQKEVTMTRDNLGARKIGAWSENITDVRDEVVAQQGTARP